MCEAQVRNVQKQGHVTEGTECLGDEDIIWGPWNQSPIDREG